MNPEQKDQRYQRCIGQLRELLKVTTDPVSRMATVASLLFYKMQHFSWIGFYRLINHECIVGPYQGKIACQKLEKNTGVCWAAINRNQTIIVPDVNAFPGHIACDPSSRSEIVIPVIDNQGSLFGVLDGDSEKLDNFDEVDDRNLKIIVSLIFESSN